MLRLKKRAFTLAEVLITLGIIGVVAALTMPTLIANYQKKATVTKLKKFYSLMNQAIQRSEAENGEITNWMPKRDLQNAEFDSFKDWYNKYLDKYIVSVSKTDVAPNEDSGGQPYYSVAFSDGTGFNAYVSPWNAPTAVYFFYCINFKKCEPGVMDTKTQFMFSICKNNGKFITADHCYGATRETLLDKCDGESRLWDCAALIQNDGWEIKDDYPW